uniref:Uncharacterized protein n=1 Tax=Oryza brachyantha TaxID=4533 RepID=J3NC71_ORYBR
MAMAASLGRQVVLLALMLLVLAALQDAPAMASAGRVLLQYPYEYGVNDREKFREVVITQEKPCQRERIAVFGGSETHTDSLGILISKHLFVRATVSEETRKLKNRKVQSFSLLLGCKSCSGFLVLLSYLFPEP